MIEHHRHRDHRPAAEDGSGLLVDTEAANQQPLHPPRQPCEEPVAEGVEQQGADALADGDAVAGRHRLAIDHGRFLDREQFEIPRLLRQVTRLQREQLVVDAFLVLSRAEVFEPALDLVLHAGGRQFDALVGDDPRLQRIENGGCVGGRCDVEKGAVQPRLLLADFGAGACQYFLEQRPPAAEIVERLFQRGDRRLAGGRIGRLQRGLEMAPGIHGQFDQPAQPALGHQRDPVRLDPGVEHFDAPRVGSATARLRWIARQAFAFGRQPGCLGNGAVAFGG